MLSSASLAAYRAMRPCSSSFRLQERFKLPVFSLLLLPFQFVISDLLSVELRCSVDTADDLFQYLIVFYYLFLSLHTVSFFYIIDQSFKNIDESVETIVL